MSGTCPPLSLRASPHPTQSLLAIPPGPGARPSPPEASEIPNVRTEGSEEMYGWGKGPGECLHSEASVLALASSVIVL